MERMFTRRAIIHRACLLATVNAVAGCAKPAQEKTPTSTTAATSEQTQATVAATVEPAPPAATTVRWWHGWGGRWVQLGQEIADTEQFKEFLPGVKFDSYGANSEKLLTSMAGGDPPDAFSQMDYYNFMARGAVLDVGEWLASSTTIDLDDIVEVRLEAGKWKGIQYGVPAMEAGCRFGLVINTRMAGEAGLDVASPPLTWDEVFEWHLKLTKFDSAGNLKVIGFDPLDAMGGWWSAYDGWMPCTCWGWDYFDVATGTYSLDHPGLVEWLKTVKRFYEHLGPDNVASYRQSFTRWGGSVNSEVQAMQIEGYWMCGETAHEAPQVSEALLTTWLPMPDSRRGKKAQCYGGHFVCIPREARNPQGGFRWAEFLNTDFARDWVYDRLGWLAPSKSFNKRVDADKYPGLRFYVDSLFQADELTAVETDPLCEYEYSQYGKLREEVYRGKRTAEEAASELQRLTQKEFDSTFKL